MVTGTARHSPMAARSRCARQVGVLQCIPTWLLVKGFVKVPYILLPGRGLVARLRAVLTLSASSLGGRTGILDRRHGS